MKAKNEKQGCTDEVGAPCRANSCHRQIVFRDPIPRGEYNLVVSTRCGDGRDYALRRIGHPVTVP